MKVNFRTHALAILPTPLTITPATDHVCLINA
ncbi:hypothetical protein Pla52n_12390 [Stieleria varia]|uniref:Uncharacterized protein n=1 Tax=Stieleria varia TaxID=2528005 RepID=A0A5C6AZQ5_9BACT|nr:hypothetical protein Pla52n_12390 [Stieleria varia]